MVSVFGPEAFVTVQTIDCKYLESGFEYLSVLPFSLVDSQRLN